MKREKKEYDVLTKIFIVYLQRSRNKHDFEIKVQQRNCNNCNIASSYRFRSSRILKMQQLKCIMSLFTRLAVI